MLSILLIWPSRYIGSCILATVFFILIIALMAMGRSLQKGTEGAVTTSLHFAMFCWMLVDTPVKKESHELGPHGGHGLVAKAYYNWAKCKNGKV